MLVVTAKLMFSLSLTECLFSKNLHIHPAINEANLLSQLHPSCAKKSIPEKPCLIPPFTKDFGLESDVTIPFADIFGMKYDRMPIMAK